MSLLSYLLDSTFFSGVPSNMTYDLIKSAWEKATQKTWEDLYLDSFQAAFNESKPYLEKYMRQGGDVNLDREAIFKILHQDLAVAPEMWTYSQLSDDKFIIKLASAMQAQNVLVIGGHGLSQDDYSHLVRNLVHHAKSSFKEAILSNEQAFRRELMGETLSNQELLRQIQDYLVKQFGFQVLGKLEIIESKVDNVVTHVQDLKNILIPFRYFITLQEYLTRPGPRFPKIGDFDEDWVYLPQHYISKIKQLLRTTHHALLVGRSAVGKTVLAIALAKQLERKGNYEVYYGDVARAQNGDGRAWYQIIQANDREGVLYILDNCHLATEEVNEFCFQWQGMPPKHSHCILISRPQIVESGAQTEEIENYFDMYADVIVEVLPKNIYRGILAKYAIKFRRENPSFYVPLQEDTRSLLFNQHAHNLIASRSRLEVWREVGGRLSEVKQEAVYEALIRKYLNEARETLVSLCILWQYEIPAHNFFVERILSTNELHLLQEKKLLTSSIVQGYGTLYQLMFHPAEAREVFYANIYRQFGYLDTSRIEAETITLLRAYLMLEPLNYVSVYKALKRQRQKNLLSILLTDKDLQESARNLFKVGNIMDTANYLSILSPIDFLRTDDLFRGFIKDFGGHNIGAKILRDTSTFLDIQSLLQMFSKVEINLTRELVAEIDMKQLARRAEAQGLLGLFKLVRFIRKFSPVQGKLLIESIPVETILAQANTIDLASGNDFAKIMEDLQELGFPKAQLQMIVETIDMKQLVGWAGTLSFQGLFWNIRTLKSISPKQARTLIDNIPMQTLIDKANTSDLASVKGVIEHLQEIGFSKSQVQTFVEALDMHQLAQRAEKQSLQILFWHIRTLKSISPKQARTLIDNIPMQTLIDKANMSDLASVKGVIEHLQEIGFSKSQVQTFVEALDMHQLAQRAEKQSFHSLFWLMRTLKSISPVALNKLLKAITPNGLASIYRSREANIDAFNDLTRVATRGFWQEFIRQFSAKDISEICYRSPLRQVGTFFQYKYPFFKQSYILFRDRFLKRKLAAESLGDIGKYIFRIKQEPVEGANLASEALDLLMTIDLSERIASTDLQYFNLLLTLANSVDETYVRRLWKSLDKPEILKATFEKSGVSGIATFIYLAANTDNERLQDLHQWLLSSDLTNKLEEADLKAIGHFLWNVFAYLDVRVAQDYCRLVDRQQRDLQLRKAPLDDLCRFLWNLIQISNLPNLETLDNPIIEERLVAAWISETGLGAELLGITTLIQPKFSKYVSLQPIHEKIQKEHLVRWLDQAAEGKNPYILALTLRGLQIYDKSEAKALVRKCLPFSKASQLLKDAKISALAPLEGMVVQEALEWLKKLQTDLTEENIEIN